MNNQISISELLKQKSSNIIDIRSHDKYIKGHIPNAVSIDYYALYYHPDRFLKFDNTYYLYCDSGVKSNSLVRKLNSKGYHTVNIIGGYKNYLLRR